MSFSTKKRFIAGVSCPKCALLDKVVAYSDGEKSYRECVACGFVDEIRLQAEPRELETRVNISAEQIAAETSPVRLIDPTAK